MSLFISSFVLAIAFCAPPGVVTAETVRRGAARGFVPALFVQFGSLVGDTTWAVIALTGLAFVFQNNIAKLVLSLLGILLMLKLAWDAIRDARYGKELDVTASTAPPAEISPTAHFFPWVIRSTLFFGPGLAPQCSHPYLKAPSRSIL